MLISSNLFRNSRAFHAPGDRLSSACRRRFRLLILMAALLHLPCVPVRSADDFRICGDCGYENSLDRRSCRHCDKGFAPVAPSGADQPGERVPDEGTPGDRGRTDTDSARTGSISQVVVKKELAIGQAHARARRYDLAALYFRNAQAMSLAAGGEAEDAQAELIVRALARCEQLSASRAGPRERLLSMGAASRRYVEAQRARHYVPVGGAWVPEGVAESLSVGEQAALMRSTAAPCADCRGIGELPCDRCAGTGHAECRNKGCERGYVRVTTGGDLTDAPLTTRRRCPVCRGNGHVACGECRGTRTLLCEDCKGSGDRELCKRCMGQGYGDCTHCGATGLRKAKPCERCGGKAEILCRTCRGEGRE